jgi:hypothetical protein
MEVGAAIAAGDGVVCIKDLAAELGDPPGVGSVNTELKVLERAQGCSCAQRRRRVSGASSCCGRRAFTGSSVRSSPPRRGGVRAARHAKGIAGRCEG